MPRTHDVDLYRHLIAAQRDGSPAATPAAAPPVPTLAVSPPVTSATVDHRYADVVSAIVAADAVVAGEQVLVGDRPLVVRIVAFDDGGPRSPHAVRHRDAVAALIILGDLDDACARHGLAGYPRLLVRAGAVAEAGRAFAAAAGFTARLDHAAGPPDAAEPALTALCALVLAEGRR